MSHKTSEWYATLSMRFSLTICLLLFWDDVVTVQPRHRVRWSPGGRERVIKVIHPWSLDCGQLLYYNCSVEVIMFNDSFLPSCCILWEIVCPAGL